MVKHEKYLPKYVRFLMTTVEICPLTQLLQKAHFIRDRLWDKPLNSLDQFSPEIALSTHRGIQNIMINSDVYLSHRNGDS